MTDLTLINFNTELYKQKHSELYELLKTMFLIQYECDVIKFMTHHLEAGRFWLGINNKQSQHWYFAGISPNKNQSKSELLRAIQCLQIQSIHDTNVILHPADVRMISNSQHDSIFLYS